MKQVACWSLGVCRSSMSQDMPVRQFGAVPFLSPWVWLAVFTTAIVGCSGSSHKLETASVEGTVTLDGQPVSAGYVFIVPSKGRMARGMIRDDGTFVMGSYESGDGVQVGTHPVIVTSVPPDEAIGNRNRVDIPRKYATAKTSGLSINVQSGQDNHIELALLSE